MKFLETGRRIETIDQLIRQKRTGTPKQLAQRLGISKSSMYKSIELMKMLDAPILYCAKNKTYYYSQHCKFTFGFLLENKPEGNLD